MVGEGLDHVPRLFVLSLVHYISRKTFRMLMRDECVFESEKKETRRESNQSRHGESAEW